VRVITNFNDSNEGGQLEFTKTSEQKTTDRITKTPENIRALCRDIKCSLLFMEITIYNDILLDLDNGLYWDNLVIILKDMVKSTPTPSIRQLTLRTCLFHLGLSQ